MDNQKQRDILRRSTRGGRGTVPQQINDESHDRSPIRDEQNQELQINEESEKTLTQLLKEQNAKIDEQTRDMMKTIFQALERLETYNKDQDVINKQLKKEIDDLKKKRNCSKCAQSVEDKKSY